MWRGWRASRGEPTLPPVSTPEPGAVDAVVAYVERLGIPVSPALRERLGGFRPRRFARGEHFVRPGAVADAIAFVIGGKVQHYYLLDGRERTRWVSLPQNFTVAFKSFVRASPSEAGLVCIEPTVLLVMPRAEFYALLDESGAMRRLWTAALETEMVRYEDRVTQLITLDARARYRRFVTDYPEHAAKVPLKYIASMLGIEPRHLSRLRARPGSSQK